MQIHKKVDIDNDDTQLAKEDATLDEEEQQSSQIYSQTQSHVNDTRLFDLKSRVD